MAQTDSMAGSGKVTSAEIRKAFIAFFEKHAHTFVPSSPVVPHDDPTLLFTNAGMNQFKPIFLGQEKRGYTRAVNTQKCIRAGGKHNDLDDVGRSRRHHTFFEMLGNWSFGDYFKQGAIEMSWDFLTKVLKLDPKLLHVTCYEGDPKSGVPRDTEAADIWRKVANWEQYGLKSDDHIHYFGAKDNFWEMGETGPCGPCTEINVDRRPADEIEAERKAGGRAPVNGDDPRVMEIWNNVFIQYNRNADRSLTVLPAQHVDTGMGFERLAQVIQDVGSNYDIDLFNPFWAKLKELSGFTYSGKFPPTNAADPVAEAADAGLRHDIAMRVIADHIRCLSFALTDGATPSNEGRGYVLRRILRRAVRFGRQQLELRDPFLYTLVDVVVAAMGDAFPELKKNPGRVRELIKAEEVSFGRTLDRGIELLAGEMENAILDVIEREDAGGRLDQLQSFISSQFGKAKLKPSGGINQDALSGYMNWSEFQGTRPTISAQVAFKLHDTFGFPIDLTRIMAEERGMSVDIAGYERLMEQAKDLARSGGKGEASPVTNLPPSAIDALQKTGAKPTEDSAKFSSAPAAAKILAIWDGKEFGQSPLTTSVDSEVAVILDETSFYAEMGGQVGDAGTITSSGGAQFDVASTKTVGGYTLHVGRLVKGTLKGGDSVTTTVGKGRHATQQNHTSTHLANWALRETLGDDVQQKGSLVDPEKLRFDFSHGKAIELFELEKIEKLVGEAIAKDLKVYAEEAPQEQALKIAGLRAVFGEKYPPMVRVVSVGAPVKELLADPANEKWRAYSIEFCGGTHLGSSKEAGGFVIVEESSVSKGIRRIVALTGVAASAAAAVGVEVDKAIVAGDVAAVNKLLAAPNVPLRAKRKGQAALVELQAKAKAAEKAAAKASAATVDVSAVSADLLAKALDLKGGKLIVAEIPGASDDQLRSVMDSLRKGAPSSAILLAGSTEPTKVTFLSTVSDDLVAAGVKAGDWAKEAAKMAGGGGGGRPQFAQAGGKDASKIGEALVHALNFAKASVKE